MLPASWRMALRLLLVIGGGYLLSAGLLGLLTAAFAKVLPRSEAVFLMAMLAFAIYLAIILWGFAEQRMNRLLVVLGAGGIACFALAKSIAP
ncbi:MAG: hypothetical protein AAF713_15950 [Pseudomonadota bacterium]